MLCGMPLDGFHAAVSGWFDSQFVEATSLQERAWAAIRSGADTLISAPTGSGKTLAAFLGVIDDLVRRSLHEGLREETSVLYVSPLKALSNDIQKNLEAPLLGIRRELLNEGLSDAPIRAWVRTGDTPQSERARMRRRPPHILVTTPESLYILLTSESGRRMLTSIRTVILDEIHALAGNKRGAHLALSLERLAELCERPLVRVGMSATTEPVRAMADFLTGAGRGSCTIVDEGHVRQRDLAIEVPPSPLEAIMANEVWDEVYDRLAELARAHRTTLVFVNTRRHAERVARHLAERLGEEQVTSHHGSLAKEHRLDAEERLKSGRLKALVATASLELGIDIGDVDLVCQLGSPRSIATFLQRVGRSGHGLGRLPKGRLFPLSRDELVECVALLDGVDRGELDAIAVCDTPLDVLAQQVVAEVSMREWRVEALYRRLARAANYRALSLETFIRVVEMLSHGFSTRRGRRSAHLHFDRVNGVLRGRRGARLTAITNGGAIPDQFDYDVLLVPGEQLIGTLNEDFAFESLPGDIFQLGNASYRILKVQSGRVHVEDARGQPPNIPFWIGEAPGRTDELSVAVSRLRRSVDEALGSETPPDVAAALARRPGMSRSAAEQLVEYLAAARAALGTLPCSDTIVLERFFDESGDSHLVIHSTLGSRINRAWGLALRKRFCRRFNFELQAAALDDSIVISLGEVHSFPLEEVVGYLSSARARDVLTQAVLGVPLFPGHWRWNATIALAVRRFRNGRKVPAQFQRTDSEDLLASVFPEQLACAENIRGEREIPAEHPLVAQTLKDCLSGVMDVEGLEGVLRRIEAGDVEVRCKDLTTPSPLAQEILGAKPYAFLDDAPAEERRTLAVQARRYLSVEQASELGRLDAQAIAEVRHEAWPEPRDADELQDALTLLGFVTAAEGRGHGSVPREDWERWFRSLREQHRASVFAIPGGAELWVSAERLGEMKLALPEGRADDSVPALDSTVSSPEEALRELTRSRLEGLGPVTDKALARALGLSRSSLLPTLVALEGEGFAMRGSFTGGEPEEWCDRRLLARIHRYTLGRLRSEIEPVSISDYQCFLFSWQGLGDDRRSGIEALAAVLDELQGLALPAAAWEREVLSARLVDYGPELMDRLSSSGQALWWRPRAAACGGSHRPGTIASSPICVLPRSAFPYWRSLAGTAQGAVSLSVPAQRVRAALQRQGALFFMELVQSTGLLRVEAEQALGELAGLGLASADAFNGLRVLLTPPSRRRGFSSRHRGRRGAPSFDAAGRWALLETAPADDEAELRSRAVEHAARALLKRYGVICRRTLARETLAPSWRELLGCFRRWEARGEIRGGRFVASVGGEQYALTEAVEALRRARRERGADRWHVLSAADPLNLGAALTGTPRAAVLANRRVVYKDGELVAAGNAVDADWLRPLAEAEKLRARSLLRGATAVHPLRRRAAAFQR
jgi:ATP-dependent Lhr-like helicase